MLSDDAAVAFNAEIHCNKMTAAFKRHGFDSVCALAPAQYTDNINLNPKIARILKINRVGCHCYSCNGACKEGELQNLIQNVRTLSKL